MGEWHCEEFSESNLTDSWNQCRRWECVFLSPDEGDWWSEGKCVCVCVCVCVRGGGAYLRLTAAEYAGSHSGSRLIQNNTITRYHSLNCYPRIERGLDGRPSQPIRIKGTGRAVAHGLLIQRGGGEAREGERGRICTKEGAERSRGWSNWAKPSDGDSWGHKHADKAAWRYIKLEAISSKPVAWGCAEQNRASFH